MFITSAPNPTIPKSLRFLFGGTAGMLATCFVQPFDLIKNRMQLSGEGRKGKEFKTSFHAIRSVVQNEGFGGLYAGLSAGLLRQATYATVRLGIYSTLFEKVSVEYGKPPGFLVKAGLGMISGGIGAFVGTPAEITLIRMTSDGRLPLAERRNYTNVFNALARIAREEGVLTLWRGCIPTVTRAMVVNAAQLASYSQSKQWLLSSPYFGDNIWCHFMASMIAGLFTAGVSMPVDIAKTRLQNMKIIDGKAEYKNAFDVMARVVRNEGVFALWKGFTPYYGRVGPHTVLAFIFLEQVNQTYKRLVLKDFSGGGAMNEKNVLTSAGLYIDESNRIRIIDPELSDKTIELKTESTEFTEKTQLFQKIVDNFVAIIENLAQRVETEKIKAVGSRNLLQSFEKRHNYDVKQLKTLIKEKTQELERLRVQYDSLKREEAEQLDLIEQIMVQK
ncbi:unnamed protein product [Medioppia subpectinata]|uniref:Mitochondrial 2-oxoglutarate/malate carrier protein n=2 Tax=Medioppia subpectinata TaxID=1979941 RepID=A0A7R9KSN0_9ACAR|nr:unnamed protein product [Medioppia subpectinata]CAG2108993.1 unnamed protein product [Medioppia subpectinata]